MVNVCDVFIFVVCSELIEKEIVVKVKGLLEFVNGKLLGVVLNDCECE